MDDAGNLHVLEAAFVAILLLTAMSFVLTFSLPTSPDDPVRADLERSATTSLGTLYDIPLNDPAYGNNTMSKALAEALKGRPGNLTNQLNATLPPGTIYNVYLNNGYGLMPVYESRDPEGQTISISRPLEPRWTYTFLGTDVGVYPNEATGSTAKMTVYGLPVVKGMPVREGGVDVDVVVTGERNVNEIGESAFEVGSSLAVVQSNATHDPDPIPHVSVTFRDSAWDPTGAIVHDDSGSPSTETLHVRLEETANRSVAAGTDLTITVPRGWNATATNDTDWRVLHNSTDHTRTDTLVVELKDALQNGTRNLTITANHHGDDYDYYTFRAELGSPAGGTGRLLVQLDSAGSTYKGEVPEAVVSAPRFLGDSGTGTWSLAFANPPSVEAFSNLTVEEITVTQPEANAIFGPVTELSESTCTGSWIRVNASALKWTADGTCTLHEHDILNLTFEVESTGNGVPGASNTPFRPPASYDNDHTTTLRDPIAQGFYHWKVPPDTITYGGFPNDGAQDHDLRSRTSYNTIPVEGDAVYGTAGLTLFKDALALGRLHTTPGVAPVGGDVDVETNVASLLLILADKGFDPTIKTHIYGPWSMGERVPFHTVDHTEQDIEDKGNVVSMATHDVSGDGVPDVLVATDESRIHGLDGRSGVKLTGEQKNYVGDTLTIFQKHDLSGTTRFAVGFEDRTSGDDLLVMDGSLNVLWSKDYSSNVVSVVEIEDFSGDGKEDLAVGLSSGRAYVYNASSGTELFSLAGQDVPARLWHGSTMGFDEEPLLLRSTGTTVDPGVDKKDLDQSDNTMTEEGDELEPGTLAESLKSVHVSTASAGLEGYDEDENVEYQYLGAAYDVMDEGDLDGDGVTDLVGGRTNGYLSTLNGTQGNGDYSLWQIATGNTIVDTETQGEYWMVTLSQDGMLMWTEDAWATRVYYYGGPVGSPAANFEYARGLDYVDKETGYIVWGITGDTLSLTTDGGENFAELNYTVDDEDGNELTLATDVAWRDIQWAGDTMSQGVLYGDDCRSISVDPTDLDSALTCPDGFIAYNGWLDSIFQWHEATLPNATGRPVTDVHLYSGTDGVAVGEDGGVWTTTDLETWTWEGLNVSGTLRDDDLRAIHMFNSSHGFAVGDDGVIFKTTDGATTWVAVDSPTNRNLQDITFQPDDTDQGWAVGNASTAIRTFDGGDEWTLVDVPMAEDEADGIDYYTVEVPKEKTGWISGGSTGTTATRLMGFFTSYVREGTAQSTSLTDIGEDAGIKNLTVYPELHLGTNTDVELDVSNDGCTSFQSADYEADTVNGTLDLINGEQPVTVEFPDTTKDELCFRANFSVSASESHFWTAWLFNLSIKYNYTDDATVANPTWETTWLNLTLDDPSQIDTTVTTARWDTDAGRIGLPLFDSFWTHILEGSVNAVTVEDLEGDGDNEVLVGTGDQWATSDKLIATGEDRRVYLYNGSTGAPEATSAKLPGRVTALETIQLVNRTLDTVKDVLVVTGDPDSGTYNLTALDGEDLTELWSTSTAVPINDVISAHLDGDALPEAVLGTAAQDDTWKAGSSEVRAHHADEDPAQVMWTAYPDLKGEYSFTYNVSRHLPFGPYVVETQVVWEGASGITQSARLYDYFVATPPGGEIPPSPLYNVELVVWYEDWG